MKILFFMHHLEKGGAERVLQALSGYFSNKNHECTIVYFGQNCGYYAFDEGISLIKLNSNEKVCKFSAKFAHIKAIRAEIKRQNPNLIISFMDFTNFDVILANLGLKSKLIITEHVNHTMLDIPRWVKVRKFLYKFTDGLTVLTQDDYEYYRFVKNREIMYNPTAFEPPAELKKEKIILSVGRLEEVKGYESYLKALSKIDKKLLLDWRILIAGDGALKDELHSLAMKLGVEVEFLGHMQDVQKLYEKAQILTLASKNEGLPNVLIESIFYDVARLATKTPGAKELIKDMENGILCEIDDEDDIAKKLTLLMSDEHLRKSIAQKAKKQKDMFSIQNIGVKWDKFIKKVMNDEKA